MVSPVNDAPEGRTSNTSHWLSGVRIGIGEQVITGSKGYLFHGAVLIQNRSRHHTSQGLHFQTIVFAIVMNVSEKMEHFDVAIIGLGPAGSALARN